MNQDKFIEIIKTVVTNSSVSGLMKNLTDPSGRKPSESILRMSKFYNQLGDEDKLVIKDIVKTAVDSGVFGFLCVLDGVRSINESFEDRGTLELVYIDDASKKETVLNNPNEDFLHDIYNAD